MSYEILKENEYDKLEKFLEYNENAQIYQAPIWIKMRAEQPHHFIVSKDENGEIVGSMSVFVVSKYGKNMLFCPRGPVFDHNNLKSFNELLDGAFELADKYKAYGLRIDPTVLRSNKAFENEVKKRGGDILFVDDREIDTSPSHVVYTLDLKNRSEQEIFDSFESRYRYKIRRSEKRGIELKVGKKEDLPEFHQLLVKTTQRKNFNGRPLAYFQKLFDTLDEKNVHLLMAYFEGELVGAALLLCYATTAIYLYGASSEKHREVMPNHLIQWNMIKWAKEQGFDTYSFGGIPGYNDEKNSAYGIYRFKKGFNGEVIEYIGEINFKLNKFDYNLREKLVPFLRSIKAKLR
ncbi:MAG: peptidoglycan bridge formation glycyltransferase FemA/FemB family protein [Ruminococcaceae bacterium]|nr:peptidoglycan bridge formation glycyltransferase FemA/FemB family protein [Oscillospiraceae bacterium]